MLGRFAAQRIPIRVHLEMEAHQESDADSADVMGEIPGRSGLLALQGPRVAETAAAC